jgi:hypothetical protein
MGAALGVVVPSLACPGTNASASGSCSSMCMRSYYVCVRAAGDHDAGDAGAVLCFIR